MSEREIKGEGKLALFSSLKRKLKEDIPFRSGKILGSMCSRPHKLAIRIFHEFIEKNIGDTGLVRATKKIEEETIAMMGRLLHAEQGAGYIVTGGTEANILAMWAARKMAKHNGNELLVPESAHFSFDKAADLLNLKIIKVKLNSAYQIDIASLQEKITENTVAIVAVAGSTPLGMIDPINAVADIAHRHGIYLHVDAAFGGYVLPFLDDSSNPKYVFDFRLEGVCSITIDPHKMGMAPIPAGGIIYRNRELAETVKIHVPYLAGGETKQSTIVGTRSGASVIAVWSLLKYLGYRGYRKIVRRCMALTDFLVSEIGKIDSMEIVIKPDLNVVGIKSNRIPVGTLAGFLRKKGWAVALFDHHIRICLMPHVKKKHLVQFTRELRKITATYDDSGNRSRDNTAES